MKKTLEEIKKYDTFIYDHFEIEYEEKKLNVCYYYEIVGLQKFIHRLEIPIKNQNIDLDYVEKLVFQIGLLELVSYYKATVASVIEVRCGKIDETQTSFFKKVYYYGLGEFFYLNGLSLSYDQFVTIHSIGKVYDREITYQGTGSLIAVGGGKDSCVTLSLLDKKDNGCFMINPKQVMKACAYAAGYTDDDIYSVKRVIDQNLLKLNEEGYFNGHTPFSAMVAFVSYLTAYLNGKKYIVLSNESSANESNVVGTKINHQYSKSYEFEHDFQTYANTYLGKDIYYYSLLRPLTEYQIGMLFSKFKKFHPVFKSCNVGSKGTTWHWCCDCAKCLFVYTLLSPHLYKDELVSIFGEDLFEKETLLTTFEELLGKRNTKPFDCVGTFEEVNYAVTKTIQKLDGVSLPYLLQYYKEHYYDESILSLKLEDQFYSEHSLNEEDVKLVKEALKDVR